MLVGLFSTLAYARAPSLPTTQAYLKPSVLFVCDNATCTFRGEEQEDAASADVGADVVKCVADYGFNGTVVSSAGLEKLIQKFGEGVEVSADVKVPKLPSPVVIHFCTSRGGISGKSSI